MLPLQQEGTSNGNVFGKFENANKHPESFKSTLSLNDVKKKMAEANQYITDNSTNCNEINGVFVNVEKMNLLVL